MIIVKSEQVQNNDSGIRNLNANRCIKELRKINKSKKIRKKQRHLQKDRCKKERSGETGARRKKKCK